MNKFKQHINSNAGIAKLLRLSGLYILLKTNFSKNKDKGLYFLLCILVTHVLIFSPFV